MEVGKGLVYPPHTLLDNIWIDTSAYAIIKVDMMHKLEVPPDDTTLTL
jgi:hypothetical protein